MGIGGAEPPASVPSSAPARMPLAVRVLYMLVFGVTFWILTWVLAISVIAQLILTVLGGQPSPELLTFSKGLSRYIGQVVEFLTFLSDKPPFPFAQWPDQHAAR